MTIFLIISIIFLIPTFFCNFYSVIINDIPDNKSRILYINKLKTKLDFNYIKYKSFSVTNNSLFLNFDGGKICSSIKKYIVKITKTEQKILEDYYYNFFSIIKFFKAKHIKLGLDLKGGVRFLIQPNLGFALSKELNNVYIKLKNYILLHKIYCNKITYFNNLIVIDFNHNHDLLMFEKFCKNNFKEISIITNMYDKTLNIKLLPNFVLDIYNFNIDKVIQILDNRINELRITESVIYRSEGNKIVLEIPGSQNILDAKKILGNTFLLNFFVIIDKILPEIENQLEIKIIGDGKNKIIMHNRPVLSSRSVVGAISEQNLDSGNFDVNIKINDTDSEFFKSITHNHVGKYIAIICKENILKHILINGLIQQKILFKERVINISKIISPLGQHFKISGMTKIEADTLSILLRSGSLPVTINIIKENVIGPTLGKQNIESGGFSLLFGLLLINSFIVMHYSFFGIVTNIVLFLNLFFILSIISIINATLTLPGIAGIVLALGMAIDSNVLIFERIREYVFLGFSLEKSIKLGFYHATNIIIDTNLTTIIMTIILFLVGSGPIKGFALILFLGLIISMYTSIICTKLFIDVYCLNKNSQ